MKTAELLNKSQAWFRDRSREMLFINTILLLKKNITPVPDHKEFTLTVYDRYDPTIIDIYRSLGRDITEWRAKARFAHRLVFYQLTRGEHTVASTWLIHSGVRFIDEVGYHFQIPENSAWIRDIFVNPQYRGRKIFSALQDVLINRVLDNHRVVWSDTEARNHASLKAHANSGFSIVDSLTIIQLNKLLLIRLRQPSRVQYVDGFKTQQKIIFTLKAYRKYKSLYLA